MRPIDAHELKKRLDKYPPEIRVAAKKAVDSMKTIKDAPTIEERKTGEWVSATVEEVGIYKVRTRRCTYCGERAIDGTSVAGATMDIINNFCPNCGADMRGGN